MSSTFWKDLGTLIDYVTDEETQTPREIVIVQPRPRREVVVVSTYREVYPLIRNESFDSNKVKKAAKCFEANRAVNIDDLLKCLRSMDFDSARSHLCKALRRPISKMSYFERLEIAECFDWTSGIPSFVND